jgi:hypothetical protein
VAYCSVVFVIFFLNQSGPQKGPRRIRRTPSTGFAVAFSPQSWHFGDQPGMVKPFWSLLIGRLKVYLSYVCCSALRGGHPGDRRSPMIDDVDPSITSISKSTRSKMAWPLATITKRQSQI